MRFRLLALGLAVGLSGCISTEMNGLVGHPIEDAQLRYGAPEQVIDMPGGSKVFQFRAGGVPALDKGCLLSFTARKPSDRWMIESATVPRGAVC